VLVVDYIFVFCWLTKLKAVGVYLYKEYASILFQSAGSMNSYQLSDRSLPGNRLPVLGFRIASLHSVDLWTERNIVSRLNVFAFGLSSKYRYTYKGAEYLSQIEDRFAKGKGNFQSSRLGRVCASGFPTGTALLPVAKADQQARFVSQYSNSVS
jgi:hypothetical protein